VTTIAKRTFQRNPEPAGSIKRPSRVWISRRSWALKSLITKYIKAAKYIEMVEIRSHLDIEDHSANDPPGFAPRT
jgi:hypothetical protein